MRFVADQIDIGALGDHRADACLVARRHGSPEVAGERGRRSGDLLRRLRRTERCVDGFQANSRLFGVAGQEQIAG